MPLLHPYDTFETVCGAGTTGLEIADQVRDADLVVVGCGGGGLYSGLAAALDDVVQVQPVEPGLCPNLATALAAGGPVDTAVGGVAVDSLGAPSDRQDRVCDRGCTRSASGARRRGRDRGGAAFLWSQARVLAEPGACVALASVLTGQVDVLDRVRQSSSSCLVATTTPSPPEHPPLLWQWPTSGRSRSAGGRPLRAERAP